MRLTAKDYAQREGHPLKTIRRLCRNKILPCFKDGRGYSIDVDEANAYFKAKEAAYMAKQQRRISRKAQPAKNMDFIQRLNAMQNSFLGIKDKQA